MKKPSIVLAFCDYMKENSKHYFISSDISKELIEFDVDVFGFKLKLKSDNGIFSKNKVDLGTQILLKNIDYTNKLNILDIGCGYGIIGLFLAKKYPNSTVNMIDINEKAIYLTKVNSKLNNVSNVDIKTRDATVSIVGVKKYDLVVFNPPIKAGKEVIFKILDNVSNVLNKKSGKLLIVNKKTQGAPSTIKFLQSLFKVVKILDKKSGYYVIEASKNIL
jgi:16S rRNA (guanine1207-N2)-methyltransferase